MQYYPLNTIYLFCIIVLIYCTILYRYLVMYKHNLLYCQVLIYSMFPYSGIHHFFILAYIMHIRKYPTHPPTCTNVLLTPEECPNPSSASYTKIWCSGSGDTRGNACSRQVICDANQQGIECRRGVHIMWTTSLCAPHRTAQNKSDNKPPDPPSHQAVPPSPYSPTTV